MIRSGGSDMRTMTMTLSLLASVAATAATEAGAQNAPANAPIEFRLAAEKSNPMGCISLDASLSRVHAVTLMGDKATLKSAGGINDTLKQTSPGVYKTVFTLGGVRLDVVADASKTPRSLTVAEAQRGCRWAAIAP